MWLWKRAGGWCPLFVMELHTNAHFEIRIPVQPQKGNEAQLLSGYSETRQACGKCYFIP